MKLVPAVLARPKSRIFRVQSDFTTILLGLRSWRWEKTGMRNCVYFGNLQTFRRKQEMVIVCNHRLRFRVKGEIYISTLAFVS